MYDTTVSVIVAVIIVFVGIVVSNWTHSYLMLFIVAVYAFHRFCFIFVGGVVVARSSLDDSGTWHNPTIIIVVTKKAKGNNIVIIVIYRHRSKVHMITSYKDCILCSPFITIAPFAVCRCFALFSFLSFVSPFLCIQYRANIIMDFVVACSLLYLHSMHERSQTSFQQPTYILEIVCNFSPVLFVFYFEDLAKL